MSKILHVVNFYKPIFEAGGPTRNTYEIVSYLLKQDYNIDVYSTNYYVKEHKEIVCNSPTNVDGATVHYFENFKRFHNIKFIPPFPLFSIPYIAKTIQNYDIIHIHEYPILSLIVSYFAKKHDIPYVFQARGSLDALMCKHKFYSHFANPMITSAAKVIALQEKEKHQYLELGVDAKNVEIIPNGVDVEYYSKLPNRGEFRKKYSISDDTNVILFLARLHQTKGVDFLIRSYSAFLKKYPSEDVILVIAGPDVDGYKSELENLILSCKNITENKILFTGALFDTDKKQAFVDADIYAFPSYLEGLPTSLLEACACGKPVVISPETNMREPVERWGCGIVVSHTEEEYADALYTLVSDCHLRLIMGLSAREMVLSEFDNNKVMERINGLYQEILTDKE